MVDFKGLCTTMNAPAASSALRLDFFKLDPSAIGRRIKTQRLARQLTQLQVGRACGLSQNSVMKIERGQTETSRFIPRIWSYLGLNLTDLSDIYAGEQRSTTLPAPDVEIARRSKALLISEISYEDVELPDAGSGKGILITWTMRNGATVAGVMDATMLEKSVVAFVAAVRRLGIDPTKFLSPPPA